MPERPKLSRRRPSLSLFLAAALAWVLGAGACWAQDAPAPGALRPLCPDRPSKGTSACTVDQGHLQLETDLFNGTWDRSGGVSTDTYLFTNPTLKFGVTDAFDIEANIVPYAQVRTVDHSAGTSSTASGVGDLYLRGKLDFAGNHGGNLGLAVEGFVKAPTAPLGVGDGAWEGGALVPFSYSLPHGWSLGVTPEADVVLNASGAGRHLALLLPVGLSHAVGPLLGTVEVWTAQDVDPSGTGRQYSLDFAAAWQPAKAPDLQIDGGVNLGLNSATPDVQVYVGLARRF